MYCKCYRVPQNIHQITIIKFNINTVLQYYFSIIIIIIAIRTKVDCMKKMQQELIMCSVAVYTYEIDCLRWCRQILSQIHMQDRPHTKHILLESVSPEIDFSHMKKSANRCFPVRAHSLITQRNDAPWHRSQYCICFYCYSQYIGLIDDDSFIYWLG